MECGATDEREAVKRRIAARQAAIEILEFAKESLNATMDEHRFWEVLAVEAAVRIDKIVVDDGPSSVPMSHEDAKKFERQTMPYGKHVGDTVAEADGDYVDFLVNSEFARGLRRYVASKHFRKRQGLDFD